MALTGLSPGSILRDSIDALYQHPNIGLHQAGGRHVDLSAITLMNEDAERTW
jgi:hypothetical protein